MDDRIFCWVKHLAVAVVNALLCGIVFAQQYGPSAIDEANRLISQGDCVGAEIQVRNGVPKPMYYTMFGLIQLDCRKNKASAIDYFKMAARENEGVARELLSQLGVQVESVVSSQSAGDPMLISTPTSPPPAHQFSTLPAQRPRVYIAPPVIVMQPMVSPYACIQDGGSTFCPYYRR